MADDRLQGTGTRGPDEGREALREWPAWLILSALWAGSLLVRSRLPSRVPLHWNLHGLPDRWGSPWQAVLLAPILATAAYGLALLLDWGRLDFRAARRMSAATTRQVRLLILALFAGLQVLVLGSAWRGGTFREGLLVTLLSIFLVLLGNLMPRLEPNAWVGIRIPPTLENREVWRRTHRLTGRWLVAAGLAGLPLSLVAGPRFHLVVLALILVPLLAGTLYAYRLRHRMEAGGTYPPEVR